MLHPWFIHGWPNKPKSSTTHMNNSLRMNWKQKLLFFACARLKFHLHWNAPLHKHFVRFDFQQKQTQWVLYTSLSFEINRQSNNKFMPPNFRSHYIVGFCRVTTVHQNTTFTHAVVCFCCPKDWYEWLNKHCEYHQVSVQTCVAQWVWCYRIERVQLGTKYTNCG